jgi:polar amino acid transport system permease protein
LIGGLDFSFLTDPRQLASLAHGALVTVELTMLAGLLSALAGAALCAMQWSGRGWLRGPARAFIEITRNTPTLVQLYCAFLVLNVLITQALRGGGNPLGAFTWVVIVIGLHAGALHSEALRAGVAAVPAGKLEAARALGLQPRDAFLHIQLPIAVRFALPALANNLIEMAKLTVIASAIAVHEITYEAIVIWTQNANVLELMCLLLLFYWLLTYAIGRAARAVERRLRMAGYGS